MSHQSQEACVERQKDEGESEGEDHSPWNRHKPYSAQNIHDLCKLKNRIDS